MSFLINSDVYSIIKEDLEDLDGKLIFVKGRYCGGKSKCSGLFYLDSKDNPVIKVAKGGLNEEEWFGVLLHEYCHFMQWRDNSKYWEGFCNYDVTYSQILLKPEKYKVALAALMELEINCERLAVKIIKNNNLFDHKTYTQSANAILYKYAFLYNFNKWPEDSRTYKKVQDLAPNRILKSYKEYLDIPKKIIEYYR
jgi:hypothetical protein